MNLTKMVMEKVSVLLGSHNQVYIHQISLLKGTSDF